MNQILSVNNANNKKNKSTQQMPIHKIVKFFAVILLIFGVFMISTGSYALYKGNASETKPLTKPTISIENKTDRSILLKVMHDKVINKVTYNWNNEEDIVIEGNGRKYIEQAIDIPSGTNTINITAQDTIGEEISYKKEYTVKANIDIGLEVVGSNIKISVTSKENLSFLTYRWDDEQETREDIEGQTFEKEIEIPKGLHKLTIVAVDINNDTETKVQDINGVTKPKVEVTIDGEYYLIKASDEIGLKKVEFTTLVDGKSYFINTEDKEFEYRFPLVEGENKLIVKVYNSNDITAEAGVMCVK